MITQSQLSALLPLAVEWAEEKEQFILENGIPLTTQQIDDALLIGIRNTHRVRLLKVSEIPRPENPTLAAAVEATQLLSPLTAGLSLRYGIFIRSDVRNNRRLIFHELVHTRQYEHLGGIAEFLAQYLQECISPGYPLGLLEQEAITTTEHLCRKAPSD